MQLRDEVEGVLRGWDRIERKQGRPAVIDYDCFPHGPVADELTDRAAVYDRLGALRRRAAEEGDDWVGSRVEADYAYLSAKLGERTDLATYLARTQGATAQEWSADYIERRRAEAIEALVIPSRNGLVRPTERGGGRRLRGRHSRVLHGPAEAVGPQEPLA